MDNKTCKIHYTENCNGITSCKYELECAKQKKREIIEDNKNKGITMESYNEKAREQNKYYPFISRENWMNMKKDNPYWPYDSFEEFKLQYDEDPEYLLNIRPECTMNELKQLINEDDDMSESTGSVKQYFTYQESINEYKNKLNKLESAQKDLIDEIKTDVETILIAYNYNELGTKIKITNKGLKIRIPVKVYNDYDICYKIDTDLFTQLNNLMGMNGRLNIENRTKYAGNMVYHIELIYELEGD